MSLFDTSEAAPGLPIALPFAVPLPLVIVLKNVAYSATEDGLLAFIASLGCAPLSVSLLLRDGQPCGVAFARFASPQAAAVALALVHGALFHGRQIKAEFKRAARTVPPAAVGRTFDATAPVFTPLSGAGMDAAALDGLRPSPDVDDALGGGGEEGDGDAGGPQRAGRAARPVRKAAAARPEGQEYRLRPADGSSWRQREARARAETGGNVSGGDASPAAPSPAPPTAAQRISASGLQALTTALAPPDGAAVHVRYAKGPPPGDAAANRGFAPRLATGSSSPAALAATRLATAADSAGSPVLLDSLQALPAATAGI